MALYEETSSRVSLGRNDKPAPSPRCVCHSLLSPLAHSLPWPAAIRQVAPQRPTGFPVDGREGVRHPRDVRQRSGVSSSSLLPRSGGRRTGGGSGASLEVSKWWWRPPPRPPLSPLPPPSVASRLDPSRINQSASQYPQAGPASSPWQRGGRGGLPSLSPLAPLFSHLCP